MSPLRVYLAGAIEKAPDGGVAWRRELTRFLRDELGHVVHDPTVHESHALTEEERRNFRSWKADPAAFPQFRSALAKIIHADLFRIVHQSDYVFTYWDEYVTPGGGTHGEVTVARMLGIPVFMVYTLPRAEMSSWILGCATEVFETFDAARDRLRHLSAASSPLLQRGAPLFSAPPGR